MLSRQIKVPSSAPTNLCDINTSGFSSASNNAKKMLRKNTEYRNPIAINLLASNENGSSKRSIRKARSSITEHEHRNLVY